jgi:beta-galactosidase
MERDHGKSDTPLPPSPRLQKIGKVALTDKAELFSNLQIGRTVKSVTIESMEEFDQSFGYILYSKTFDYNPEMNAIKLVGLHDRAHIFLNGRLVGILMRGGEDFVELPQDLKAGDKLDILVENMGRICFGEDTYFGDKKGISGGVMLTHRKNGVLVNPGKVAFNWTITCLEMEDISGLHFNEISDFNAPAFYRGSFKTESRDSCFVRFDNLKKGIIFINGFNLGRYWEKGPLEALFIPGVILKDENEIIVFETDGMRGEPSLEITDICGIPNHHEEIRV